MASADAATASTLRTTTTRLSIYSALTLPYSPEQAQEEPGSYASGEETEPLAFGAQLAREAEREAER